MSRAAVLAALLSGAALLGPAAPSLAQRASEGEDTGAPVVEEPDPTRLDVERLPPEAIPITRALYAHGFFVEAALGARGFVNAIGEIVDVGPWATIHVGVELFEFLHVLVSAEGSMHQTSAPAPPAPTSFELLGGTASLRLQGNFTPELALWLAGQVGILVATTDVLGVYSFQDASTVGVTYGGEAGVDWHLRSRHHSLGLSGGVRHYPSLESPLASSPALGVHGAAYLRYVF